MDKGFCRYIIIITTTTTTTTTTTVVVVFVVAITIIIISARYITTYPRLAIVLFDLSIFLFDLSIFLFDLSILNASPHHKTALSPSPISPPVRVWVLSLSLPPPLLLTGRIPP
jgi:hypothetical protein